LAEPARDGQTLTLGQRLMLGLVIAPGSLLMALGTLDSLATGAPRSGTLGAVVDWIYVLFLAGVGVWTATMAVTGRGPRLTP
jgi:hypothetical protein